MELFPRSVDDGKLDEVMTYFAEDAVYRTIQGDTARGKAEIRKAFEPQFNGAYGQIRFEITGVYVDEESDSLTLLWTCFHDFTPKATTMKYDATRLFYRAISPQKPHWHGVDVFEFDAQGKIKKKSSFTISKLPRMFATQA